MHRLFFREEQKARDDCFTHVYNVVLLGDKDAGKTSIIYRYLYQREPTDLEKIQAKIGYSSRVMKIEGHYICLRLWDVPGNSEFLPDRAANYDAAIIVYPKATKAGLKDVIKWHEMVEETAKPDAIKLLVGSKADVARQVSFEYGLNHRRDANQYFYIPCKGYIEVDSKSSQDAIQLFTITAEQIMIARGLDKTKDACGRVYDCPVM